jgi:hypothetical protein
MQILYNKIKIMSRKNQTFLPNFSLIKKSPFSPLGRGRGWVGGGWGWVIKRNNWNKKVPSKETLRNF